MKIKKIKIDKVYTIKEDDYPFLAGEKVRVTYISSPMVEVSNGDCTEFVEAHNLRDVSCSTCIFKLFGSHYPCNECHESNECHRNSKWRKFK